VSCLSQFYDHGIKDAELLEHSPVANVRRPKVCDDSSTVGLTADELDRLLTAAEAHGPRSAALVSLLVYNGLRIAEVLACDIEDFSHQRGHRVLRIVRKGGKASTGPLAPTVLHPLELYVGERASGPIFLNAEGTDRLSYSTSYASSAGSPGAPASPAPRASARTACVTASPPSARQSACRCRTSKTPWCTPTRARRRTTAPGTTSTDTRRTRWRRSYTAPLPPTSRIHPGDRRGDDLAGHRDGDRRGLRRHRRDWRPDVSDLRVARGWRTRVDVRISHGSIVPAGAITHDDLLLFKLVIHSGHVVNVTLLGFAPTSRQLANRCGSPNCRSISRCRWRPQPATRQTRGFVLRASEHTET
jgi:integrase